MSKLRPTRVEPQDARGPSLLIAAANMVREHIATGPGWVEVLGHSFVAAGVGKPPREPDMRFRSGFVVPGFVDTHCHGGGGATFGADAWSNQVAADIHAKAGATTILASLVSASLDHLREQVSVLVEQCQEGLIGGIHLEGPWLSPKYMGAHDPRCLRPPTGSEVGELLRIGRGFIRMVTLAPELEGAMAAIHQIREHGAVVAIGHTDADAATVRTAIKAGATSATHIFNAMRPVHHRNPGPIPDLLVSDHVDVEVIADGVHVDPAVVRLVAAAKRHQWRLVSDAMAACGLSDGSYTLGSSIVEVEGGVARLSDSTTIAGSVSTIAQAIRWSVQRASIPLPNAVAAATWQPAKQLGLTDRGRLDEGALADLVALDADLQVTDVMRHGRWT